MNIPYCYFLICFLLPRLFLQWRDEPLKDRAHLTAVLIELILLLPLFTPDNWYLLLLFLGAYHLFSYQLEKSKRGSVFFKRMAEAACLVVAGGFLFGFLPRETYNERVLGILRTILTRNVLIPDTTSHFFRYAVVYTLALLVVVNEIKEAMEAFFEKRPAEYKGR